MNPIDTYRTAFLSLLRQGMTHAEALCEFDPAQYDAAVREEIELRGPEVVSDQTSLLNLGALAMRERRNETDMAKAVELWLAGWTSEAPREGCDVMSWFWRRPSLRPGKPGRCYKSTDQAVTAMRKQA